MQTQHERAWLGEQWHTLQQEPCCVRFRCVETGSALQVKVLGAVTKHYTSVMLTESEKQALQEQIQATISNEVQIQHRSPNV